MAETIDNQNAGDRSDSGNVAPNRVENNSTPAANPVAQQTQSDGNSEQTKEHCHRKKSAFEISTKIIEIGVAMLVGGALVCVGALQYSVYNQQASIMKADHRPWIGIAGNLTAQSDLT